jgi:hypothetical protein
MTTQAHNSAPRALSRLQVLNCCIHKRGAYVRSALCYIARTTTFCGMAVS